MRVLNVAHGPLLMLGALHHVLALPAGSASIPYLSLPVSMPLLFVVGLLLQRSLVRRVVDAPELSSLLLTFGVSIALVNLAQLAFTSDLRSVEYLTGSFVVGPFALSKPRAHRLRLRDRRSPRGAFVLPQFDAPGQGHPRRLPEPRGGPGVRHQRAAHPPARLRPGRGAGRRGRLAASR